MTRDVMSDSPDVFDEWFAETHPEEEEDDFPDYDIMDDIDE